MTKPRLPWGAMILFLPFSLFLIGMGLFFCLLPWLCVIGIPLLLAAGWPYAYWMSQKIKQDIAYAERDHSLNEGEEKPWEAAVIEIDDDDLIDIVINSTGRGRHA